MEIGDGFKPIGAGKKYTAEDDSFAMLMAVIHNRRRQELVPLAELDEWNAEMKDELSAQGRTDFHEWIGGIAHRARQLDTLFVQTARDEGWWWRWILGPLRTKIKLLHFLFGDAYLREKHRSCCTKKIEEALNAQITLEGQSSHAYLGNGCLG